MRVQLMKDHLKLWKNCDLLQLIFSGIMRILLAFFHIFLPTVKFDHHQTYLYSVQEMFFLTNE